jgi:hypothetical protein
MSETMRALYRLWAKTKDEDQRKLVLRMIWAQTIREIKARK